MYCECPCPKKPQDNTFSYKFFQFSRTNGVPLYVVKTIANTYRAIHLIYTPPQGCKLLSDIGQCPTKFGKCPSKSNFDRTLVRSQNKIVTLKLSQGILAFYLTLRRNGYTYLSRDLYISCDVYMSDQIQVMSDQN